MRKLTVTLSAAALALATMAMTAGAQTQSQGAASFQSLKNATPVIQRVACDGKTGGHGCGAGWVWNGNRCVRC
jgi:uncharacterized low-complexity protein